MEVIKKISKIFCVIVLLVLIFVIFSVVNHQIKNKKESTIIQNAYGEFYTLSTGEKMNYTFYDSESDKVAVILPGFGCSTVHYDFDALAKGLNDEYKIIIVEPLGYGLSDGTDRERTCENYCTELHELISKLGYDRYTIIGHSISGLYSLVYCNTYEDEVEAFIGIDATVPKQIEYVDSKELPDNQYKMMRWVKPIFINTGMYRFFVNSNFRSASEHIPTLSEEDKKIMQTLYGHNMINDTQLNELKNWSGNMKEYYDDTFPESIPVLYLLANDSQSRTSQWKSIHENMTVNEKSAVKVLKGAHALHLSSLQLVIKSVKDWNSDSVD